MHSVHRCTAPRIDVLLPLTLLLGACADAGGSGDGGRSGAAPDGPSTSGGRLPETDVGDGASSPSSGLDAAASTTGDPPDGSGAATAGDGGAGSPAGSGGRGGAGGRAGAGGSDGGAPATSSGEASTADASSGDASSVDASSGVATSAAATTTGASSSSAASTGSGGAPGSMSFFVTSVGHGSGNFGGLPGVDAFCQALAAAAGAGDRTWRAFVSTSVVDARDRIGAGPWYDVQGALVATDVPTLIAAGVLHERALDENGAPVPNAVTAPGNNEHDILTGSTPGGTFSGDACADWTSASPSDRATAGHCDASFTEGGGTSPVSPSDHWSSTHTTQGCDAASLDATGSTARVYCFAL